MRELDCGSPRGGQETTDTFDEIVDVGDVSEDVIGHHEVGRPSFSRILSAREAPKNSAHVGTPLSSAMAATLAAGSTPMTRQPASTKLLSRCPSLLANSTTKLPEDKAKSVKCL